ncbi:hypothetical protein BKA83DRAFT_4128005 [Pisolithus microcarpus]|nr:hypothetical protein BKA83DRAFT_4128005 [Pisolithus microcarpus]
MSEVKLSMIQFPLCIVSPEPVKVPQSIGFLDPGNGELLLSMTNFVLHSGNLKDQLRLIPFCMLLILFFFFPHSLPLTPILRDVYGGNVVNDLNNTGGRIAESATQEVIADEKNDVTHISRNMCAGTAQGVINVFGGKLNYVQKKLACTLPESMCSIGGLVLRHLVQQRGYEATSASGSVCKGVWSD